MVKSKVKTKLNPCDFTLCVTVALLLSLGIVMVLSASSPSSLAETGSSYTYVIKQLQSALIGVVLMVLISKIDYKMFNKPKVYIAIYVISILILLLVLVPNIGVKVNGAKRWVNFGIQFQPSEITKIGLIIFYAAILTKNKDKLKKISTGFFAPLLFIVLPAAILIGVQDHLSVTIVIGVVVAIMMLVAGTKPIYFATFGSAGIAAGGALLYYLAKFTEKGGFRLQRLSSFLNPWADAQGSRMAGNSKFICNWIRWLFWSRIGRK